MIKQKSKTAKYTQWNARFLLKPWQHKCNAGQNTITHKYLLGNV